MNRKDVEALADELVGQHPTTVAHSAKVVLLALLDEIEGLEEELAETELPVEAPALKKGK